MERLENGVELGESIQRVTLFFDKRNPSLYYLPSSSERKKLLARMEGLRDDPDH